MKIMAQKQRIVIVGGGFGGIKAALELCENEHFDVVLISDNKNFRYYPSLYHTATGGSKEVSSIKISEIFESKNIDFINAEVTAIDREKHSVQTKDGKNIEYDSLILALGVVTNYFNIPGLAEYSYGIKTLEDAERFKEHLHKQLVVKQRPDQNYVIVGGGPTGIELAGVLGKYIQLISKKHGIKHRAVNVELVEAAPSLVPRMPRDVSRNIAKHLRRSGVKLYFNTTVNAQTADQLMINNRPIDSHTVVWTAGTSNHPFFANNNFQLAPSKKVRVDQYLQAERNVYVIGDNADTPYSGLAQTALYDGRYVAQNIICSVDGKSPKPYKAKKPIYVLPAGPDWAAVLWGGLRIYGILGWWLRRAADFIAYRDYEPWFKATRHWMAEYEREELCPLCDKK
jgi:NADH dehydrogenase